MGLDIYGHFVTRKRERKDNESLGDYVFALQKEEDKAAKRKAKAEIKKISTSLHEKEQKHNVLARFDFLNVVDRMKKYFKYDYETDGLKEAKTADDFDKWAKEIDWDIFYAPCDFYFRKVNFIYAYFYRKGLEDEVAWVTKEDVKDILERSLTVLYERDTEVSMELLPTQGGFFFGSTEYDNCYYDDVVRVIEEFSKLLNEWKYDKELYVRMSW